MTRYGYVSWSLVGGNMKHILNLALETSIWGMTITEDR